MGVRLWVVFCCCAKSCVCYMLAMVLYRYTQHACHTSSIPATMQTMMSEWLVATAGNVVILPCTHPAYCCLPEQYAAAKDGVVAVEFVLANLGCGAQSPAPLPWQPPGSSAQHAGRTCTGYSAPRSCSSAQTATAACPCLVVQGSAGPVPAEQLKP